MTDKQFGEPVVTLKHLSKDYTLAGRKNAVTALRDIDLSEDGPVPPVRKGEFFMLRGPSGGGKTTLLNILGTLDLPTRGTVNVLGKEITASSHDKELSDLRLRKIGLWPFELSCTFCWRAPLQTTPYRCALRFGTTGFVFQTFNLLATMSAYENIELPMLILGKLSAKERHERTLKLLEMVGLQDRMGHLPSELSGGEQQRVTIARALANNPELLLLDEPTGDLDTKNTIEVMDLLLKLNLELRTTCIMVTHNPDVECYADRIVYIQDGRIVKQAINARQVKLEFRSYIEYLNAAEQKAKLLEMKRFQELEAQEKLKQQQEQQKLQKREKKGKKPKRGEE